MFMILSNDVIETDSYPGDRIISVQHRQYDGCWCPGSFLHRQSISIRDIDYGE